MIEVMSSGFNKETIKNFHERSTFNIVFCSRIIFFCTRSMILYAALIDSFSFLFLSYNFQSGYLFSYEIYWKSKIEKCRTVQNVQNPYITVNIIKCFTIFKKYYHLCCYFVTLRIPKKCFPTFCMQESPSKNIIDIHITQCMINNFLLSKREFHSFLININRPCPCRRWWCK